MRVALTVVPLWAALLPLAAYLVVLGVIHLRRRPLPVSGQVDIALLSCGLAGLVVAGPLALLQPAAGISSAWAALALVLGFVLVIGFAMLAARPRMIIYNVSLEQLRPLVASVVNALDPSARWAGETAALPARGLQLHLDDRGPARSVSVIAAGRSSAEAWAEFSRRMRRALRQVRVRANPWAWAFITAGAALVALAIWLALTGS